MKSKLPYLHLSLLILLLAGVSFLFYASEKKIKEIGKLQIEVNEQSGNIEKLADLESVLPTLTEEMKTYLKTLPANETDVAVFASTVEQTARSLNLSVTFHFDDFTKLVEVSGQNIYGLGTEMVLDGSFENLTNFLSRLSGLPYFFKIDKMSLVKHETKPGVRATINGALMMNIEKK